MPRIFIARVGALIAAILLWTWLLAQQALMLIGATTVVDDFNLLVERLPLWAEWLFRTPWWVPAGLASAITCFLIWLAWPQTQRVSHTRPETEPIPPHLSPAAGGAMSPLLPPDEQSEEPEKEVSPELYNMLVNLSLDYLMPACKARIYLQHVVLTRAFRRPSVRDLVYAGLWSSDEAKQFQNAYWRLEEGIGSTAGQIIRFQPLVGCIDILEKTYEQVCKLNDDLADSCGTCAIS